MIISSNHLILIIVRNPCLLLASLCDKFPIANAQISPVTSLAEETVKP